MAILEDLSLEYNSHRLTERQDFLGDSTTLLFVFFSVLAIQTLTLTILGTGETIQKLDLVSIMTSQMYVQSQH